MSAVAATDHKLAAGSIEIHPLHWEGKRGIRTRPKQFNFNLTAPKVANDWVGGAGHLWRCCGVPCISGDSRPHRCGWSQTGRCPRRCNWPTALHTEGQREFGFTPVSEKCGLLMTLRCGYISQLKKVKKLEEESLPYYFGYFKKKGQKFRTCCNVDFQQFTHSNML